MIKDKFSIKLHLVILATEISLNQQYVLSTSKEEITLPCLYLENNFCSIIEDKILSYAQSLVFTNELELTPQLININDKNIDSVDGELNAVYGFVISKTDNINQSSVHWIPFDYIHPNKYSHLLFEVTQKLK